MTTARRHDEDGHEPDATRQPGGYGDSVGTWDVHEDAGTRADIQGTRPGMFSAADLGDARPVSLLGLRIPDLEGERDATVSRRASRPRPGGGRGDGVPARPVGMRTDAGRRTPSRPARGEVRPAARGGERGHAGPGVPGPAAPGPGTPGPAIPGLDAAGSDIFGAGAPGSSVSGPVIPGSGISGASAPEPGVAEGRLTGPGAVGAGGAAAGFVGASGASGAEDGLVGSGGTGVGHTGSGVTGSSVIGATAPDAGVAGAAVSEAPAPGAAVPEGGGGAASGTGAVVTGSGIAGAGVIGAGASGAGQAGSEVFGGGVTVPDGAGTRPGTGLGGLETPVAAGRPPVRASDGPGWTPDVGEFRGGAGPVSAGPPRSRATVAGRLAAGHGGLDTVETRCRWVHIGGLEGGCGRTTVTAGIAMALAASRRDRIIAVDVSPGQPGTLAARLGPLAGGVAGRGAGHTPGQGEFARAAIGLPALLPEIRRFVPGSGETSPAGPLATAGPLGPASSPGPTGPAGPASAGLDVMLGASGAGVGGHFVEEAGRVEEVGRALEAVGEWYEVALVDGPPGWSRPLPAALLARADILVLTVRASVVALSAVDDALNALAGSGRGELADSVTIAVVESAPTRWSGRARRRLARLAERTHNIVVVPFDPVLADGRAVVWSGLRRRTRAAFGELAAAVDPDTG
ncbi:chromosome partitioning ATPase-like protein [Candidatus Protofrankia datiscae]|uniref:Chromosome partitioning ATPase-like protein n=1 Tax=Candidatus Protofrankia datiscae TaxID=2716812 RepID=F8AZV8_9ACTN|nr:chromosome partitioning ATPase-like protein [Candidatus Protofrankia datiscae]AEH10597.1 chromosome partitioning ATPase-like protein [Candidatus Protofrankia datiscae]